MPMGHEIREELEAIADVMAAQGDDAPKVAKTRTKYLRSPLVIAAGAAPGDSPERTAENRYAVAAGIQNLLLAAHAHGLAALWGSPMRGANATLSKIDIGSPTGSGKTTPMRRRSSLGSRKSRTWPSG